ncbi:MAG: DNA internalization-related competence protein ComEC/Rec2 [bacterium]|nr:DNA internalization-related competence protein ComEC/Rec2 [bacterium]
MPFLSLWLAGYIGGLVLAEAGLHLGTGFVLGLHAAAAIACRGPKGLRLAVAFVGAVAGLLSLGSVYRMADRHRPVTIEERVVEADVARIDMRGGRARVALDRLRAEDGRPAPARLEIWTDPGAGPDSLAMRPVGCRVRMRVRIAPLKSASNPGLQDPAKRARRRGIGALGSLVDPRLQVPVAGRCGTGRLARARQASRDALLARGAGGALLAALALGEAGALDPRVRERLAGLGLSHLLAVSGLHLALVAGLVFGVLRAALPRSLRWDVRRVALFGALGAAASYAMLAGGQIPVQRAWILLAALSMAAVRRRPLPRRHGLVAAAALLLLVEPAALFAPGAQLSFAAAAALGRSTGNPQGGLRGRIGRLLHVSSTAILATAPLAAWHLGRVAWFGLLVNLFAVPLVGLFLLPLALAAALLAAWPVAVPAVDGAAAVAAHLLGAAEGLAGALPASPQVRPSSVVVAVAFAIGIVAMGRSRTRYRVLASFAVIAVLVLGPPPRISPGIPRMIIFDVGQGDAILVQTGRSNLLIDAGAAVPGRFDRGRSVVVPALVALGVRRLDLIVATHADVDHRGGLPAVLDALPAKRLWLPPGGRLDPAFRGLLESAGTRGVKVEEREAGDSWHDAAGSRVSVLWPSVGFRTPNRNAGSLVLRIDVAGCRVLLPGDLPRKQEAALLAHAADLRADVLLLGHHGSRTSTSPAWLRAIDPDLAVVSAPWRSRFGFPHAEVREAVDRQGARFHWTGRDGAVLIGLNPLLPVRTFGEMPRGAIPEGLEPGGMSSPGPGLLNAPRCAVDTR